jgi:predicted Zn-dependent peptidase
MRTLILLGTLALSPVLLSAQKEAPPAPGTPRDFRVPPRRTFALPNGMQVTLARYGVVPKVAVNLTLQSGGIDEAANEVELAGLTADMLVEGTTTRSAADISRLSADMGGGLTAGAGDNQVNIGGEVLSESAERYLALLADVVLHPRFAAEDVERLRANRIRDNAIALSTPGQITRSKFRQMIFGDHPYGRVFAPESMLNGYTSAKVREFYGRNYGARRAHLYVTGVFDQAKVERAIRTAFAGWTAGPAPTIRPPTPVNHRQLELVDRPDAVQSSIRVGLPVADPTSPDWVRLNVTDALLGGAFGSRITSNIRENKGYTYSPFSFVGPWPGTGLWVEVADVTTNVTGPSLKEIFYEVDRLRTEAPPEAELRGIKNNMVGLFTIQNSSRGGLMGQLQFVDQYGLGDAYLSGYVKNVMEVSPEQVQQTAQKYLDPNRMTITVVGDKKTVEPQLEPYRAGTP